VATYKMIRARPPDKGVRGCGHTRLRRVEGAIYSIHDVGKQLIPSPVAGACEKVISFDKVLSTTYLWGHLDSVSSFPFIVEMSRRLALVLFFEA
jgi:hypothetical protein